MRQNLALSEGLIASEAVTMHLAPRLARQRSHELVHEAYMVAFEQARPDPDAS